MSALIDTTKFNTTSVPFSIVGTSAFTYTTSIDMPAGIQAGDIGFIVVASEFANATATGWTAYNLSSSTTRITALVKVLSGSETTITISGASSDVCMGVIVVRGVTSTSLKGSQAKSSTNASVVGFSKSAGCLAILALSGFYDAGSAGSLVSGPTGFTTSINQNSNGSTHLTGGYIGYVTAAGYTNGTNVSVSYIKANASIPTNGLFVFELT
jgi:hypothetical protein